MTEEKKLMRISLQFFAEEGEDNNPDDDFFDDDENYEDEDYEDEDADADADDQDNSEDTDGDNKASDDEGGDDSDKNDDNGKSQDSDGDLISELRALGFVGNDLASLTKDMRAKREAKAEQDAKAESEATKAAGKSHIKSGKPGKGASGDGTGGITEGQVARFAETAGVSREEARRALSKHARLINGR